MSVDEESINDQSEPESVLDDHPHEHQNQEVPVMKSLIDDIQMDVDVNVLEDILPPPIEIDDDDDSLYTAAAGIRCLMATGDAPKTAMAVARNVSLIRSDVPVLCADVVVDMPDALSMPAVPGGTTRHRSATVAYEDVSESTAGCLCFG